MINFPIAGWDGARVAHLAGLVEAYAAADTAQQVAVQARLVASGRMKDAETAVRRWYGCARSLIKIAIRDANPTDRQQLPDLLGLA